MVEMMTTARTMKIGYQLKKLSQLAESIESLKQHSLSKSRSNSPNTKYKTFLSSVIGLTNTNTMWLNF